jgi:hypothetical protein
MPKGGKPTQLRQRWFIYASLLTSARRPSLIRPVVVTETLNVWERTLFDVPQGTRGSEK